MKQNNDRKEKKWAQLEQMTALFCYYGREIKLQNTFIYLVKAIHWENTNIHRNEVINDVLLTLHDLRVTQANGATSFTKPIP